MQKINILVNSKGLEVHLKNSVMITVRKLIDILLNEIDDMKMLF